MALRGSEWGVSQEIVSVGESHFFIVILYTITELVYKCYVFVYQFTCFSGLFIYKLDFWLNLWKIITMAQMSLLIINNSNKNHLNKIQIFTIKKDSKVYK